MEKASPVAAANQAGQPQSDPRSPPVQQQHHHHQSPFGANCSCAQHLHFSAAQVNYILTHYQPIVRCTMQQEHHQPEPGPGPAPVPLLSQPADRVYPYVSGASMRDRSGIPKGHRPLNSLTRPSTEDRQQRTQALDYLDNYYPVAGHSSLSKHPVLGAALPSAKNRTKSSAASRRENLPPRQSTDATGHKQDVSTERRPTSSSSESSLSLPPFPPFSKSTSSVGLSRTSPPVPTIAKVNRATSTRPLEDLGFARKEKKVSQQPRSTFQTTHSLLEPRKARKLEPVEDNDDLIILPSPLNPGGAPSSAILLDSPPSEKRHHRVLSERFTTEGRALDWVSNTPTKSAVFKQEPSKVHSLFDEDAPTRQMGLQAYDSTDDELNYSAGPGKKKAQREVKDNSTPVMSSKSGLTGKILRAVELVNPFTKTDKPGEITTAVDEDLAQQMAERTHLHDKNQDTRQEEFSPNHHKKRSREDRNLVSNKPAEQPRNDHSRFASIFPGTAKKALKRREANGEESPDELEAPPRRTTIQPRATSRGQKTKAAKQVYATSVTELKPARQKQEASIINPKYSRGKDFSHLTEDAFDDTYELKAFRTYGLGLDVPAGEVLSLLYDPKVRIFHIFCTGKDGYEYYTSFDHTKATKAVSDNDSIVRLTGPRIGRNVWLYDLRFDNKPMFLQFMEHHMETLTGFNHDKEKSTPYMEKVWAKPLNNDDDDNSAAVDDGSELHLLEARTQNHSQKMETQRKSLLVSQLRPSENAGRSRPMITPHVQKGIKIHLPSASPIATRSQRLTRAASAEIKAQTKKVAVPGHAKFPKWDGTLTIKYGPKRRAFLIHEDVKRLDEDEWLNDALIDFKMLWDIVNSGERSKSVYSFNTHFYTSLTTGTTRESPINYGAVARWTRDVDIFSHDYIMVPVNENMHWYLVLVCNVSNIKRELLMDESSVDLTAGDEQKAITKENMAMPEDLDAMELVDAHTSDPADGQPPRGILLPSPSKSREAVESPKRKKATRDPDEPVILVLDSLGRTHPKAVKCIKAYLAAEGQDKRQIEVDIPAKPLYVKSIPQQDNGADCGIYVLAFIEKFMEDPRAFVQKILSGEMDAVQDWPNMDAANLRSRLQTQLMRGGELQQDKRSHHHGGKKGVGKSAEPESDSLSFLRMAQAEMTAEEPSETSPGIAEATSPGQTAKQNDSTARIPPGQSIRDSSPRVVIPSTKSANSPKTPTSTGKASPRKPHSTKRTRSKDDVSDTSRGSKSPRASNASPNPQPSVTKQPSVVSITPSVKRRRSEDVSDEESRRAKSPKKGNMSPNAVPGSETKPISID